MKTVLFIHRSVGHHLLQQGKLRELLHDKDVALDDYDNNTGVLTRDDAKTLSDAITMPGNNTNPDNLAEFFASWPDVLDGYDLIIIKSCYPNSHIKDEAQLDTVKQHYQAIFQAFKDHKKKLLVLTTPPLRPLFTNQTEAKLASELADWLVSSAGANIQVFDLHHAYAEITGKHKGMLKLKYRRVLPWDNHPNQEAHQAAAPQIANLIT